MVKKIKLIDFSSSSLYQKTPFEIEFICKHDLNAKELGLRYTGFHNVVVETKAFYSFRAFLNKNKFYIENFKIATWENLGPCFQAYEEGFIKGFYELTDKIKDETSLFSNDFQNTAKKIFENILRLSTFVTWSNVQRKGKTTNVLKKEHFFESGIKEGQKYKAWFYIMENPDYFISLFRNHKPFIDFYSEVIEFYKNESYMLGVVQRLQEVLQEVGNLIPETLKELFIDDTAYNECMNALREVTKPIISDDNRYLLGPRQKGAFTAWYEVVKLRQKFKENPTAAILAKLLNREILYLKLHEDGSTLNRNKTTMYKKYYSPLSKLII